MKRWIPLIVLVGLAIWWSTTAFDGNETPSRSDEPGARPEQGEPQPGLGIESGDSTDSPNPTPEPGADVTEKTWLPDPHGLPIAGRVVDERGSSVAGAVVRFIARSFVRQPTEELPAVRTAKDGGFRLDGLPEGIYVLSAEAPLHGRGSLDNVPAGRTDLRLVLSRAGRIAVRLDLPEGTAEPDPVRVQVSVERRDEATGEHALAGGRTAEELLFHVDGLRAGRYRVTARLIGVGVGSVEGIEVRRGETSLAMIVPTDGAVLTGRVVSDLEGTPIEGALVVAGPIRDVPAILLIRNEPTAFGSGAVPTRTDQEGRFRIPGLLPGRHAVAARAEGLQPVANEDVEIPREEDLVLRLTSGGEIEVLVLDREERPVKDAAVSAEFGEAGFASAETDDQGRCRLPALPPGAVQLTAETGVWTVSGPAMVIPGKLTHVTLRHPTGGGNLTGSLTQRGQPVVDRILSFESVGEDGGSFSLETQTGPDGKYRIKGVPVGPVELVVHDRRHIPVMRRTAEIRPGENTLDIDLPAGVLRLRVLDEVTGKPLPATHIHFDSGRRTWTDGSGRVTVSDLEEEEHVLQFRANGHTVKVARLTPVADAAETVIRLRPASLLEVSVLDPEGNPVPAPGVAVLDPDGRRLEHFLKEWDSDTGTVRLTLEPGNWKTEFTAEGFAPAERIVTVAPEGTSLTVVLMRE